MCLRPVPIAERMSAAGVTVSQVSKRIDAQLREKPLKPGRIRRVRGLDGFRGLAVLAVVIFHAFPGWLTGGFLGVDIFFVLSGFLITSLLVREFGATGRVSLKNFWVRRLRRIVPAALTVLVIIVAVAGLVGPDVNVNLGPQFFGTALFANNWVQIAQSASYFADTGENVTRHYWSLAIEEQFYILWPLLFVALAVWGHRRRGQRQDGLKIAAIVVVVLAVASAVAMAVLVDGAPGSDPSRVYYGTDTHAFGLLIGVLLALVITDPAPAAKDSWPSTTPGWMEAFTGTLFGTFAFAGIIVLCCVLEGDNVWAYRGGIFLASALAAVVIHVTVREAGLIAALMRFTPLCWLGTRSFSVYLLHWPIFVFVTHYLKDAGILACGLITVALSLILAELSFRFVEEPVRRGGYGKVVRSWKRYPFIPLLIVALAAGAGVAIAKSPAESSTEQALNDLKEKQEAQRKAQQDAQAGAGNSGESTAGNGAGADGETGPGSEARDTSDSGPGKFPDGTDITIVGDSVTLASYEALSERFPGAYIDGEVSRHYEAALPILTQLRDSGQLGHYVVLGFGTNGQAFPGQISEIKDFIGPDRTLILLDPYGMANGVPEAAAQVEEYIADNKDVYLAPWCHKAVEHPETLRPDGFHPEPEGAVLYTDAVEEAIQQAVDGKQRDFGRCAIY